MSETIVIIKSIIGKLKRNESMATQLSDEADLIDELMQEQGADPVALIEVDIKL